MQCDKIRNENDILETIDAAYASGAWWEVIELGRIVGDITAWRKVLWPRPDEGCLEFIAANLAARNLEGITSIGCGSGLLEWLLQEATGIHVTGVEVDSGWWSRRSTFIPLKFVDAEQIQIKPNTALMFCYFNNGQIFQDYVKQYQGTSIIILGPGPGRGAYCDPEPLKPNFQQDSGWTLSSLYHIADTKDCVAIYDNLTKKQ